MTTRKTLIRDEAKYDAAVIAEVTVAAFQSMEISNHTEQFIIEALRSARALTLSLVAEVDGRVVGHIAFSPVAISDGAENWYGLGPVSVLPMYQRMGIGKALIREGLSRLKDLGAKGCCLVGHPQYYRKLGFENVAVHPLPTLDCNWKLDGAQVELSLFVTETLYETDVPGATAGP